MKKLSKVTNIFVIIMSCALLLGTMIPSYASELDSLIKQKKSKQKELNRTRSLIENQKKQAKNVLDELVRIDQNIDTIEQDLTSITLTGLPYKKVRQYAKENNPFNILEHPHIMEPNKKQLEKIGLLNEFISSYSLLKIYESEEKIKLNSPTVSGQYFLALLSGMKDRERFMVAFLDNGNNIIETKTMSEGSVGQTAVYPREILKYALACDCTSMILAHNHPGGSQNFSPEDKSLTQRFVDIFHPLEIKILDHIVVGGTSFSSMAEKGDIPRHCRNKANYEAIALEELNAEEKGNRFKHTHSRWDCLGDSGHWGSK